LSAPAVTIRLIENVVVAFPIGPPDWAVDLRLNIEQNARKPDSGDRDPNAPFRQLRVLELAVDGEPLSYALFVAPEWRHGGPLLHLVRTHDDYQGRGFGEALVDDLKKRYPGVRIEATTTTPAGERLVRRCGFLPTGDLVVPWAFDPAPIG
jgi:GNAT superfamily N-acetyltransferase